MDGKWIGVAKESHMDKAKALKVKDLSNSQKSSKKQTKNPNVDNESSKKSSRKKEFNCSICDKKCNKSYNLKNHILSHFYDKFESIVPNSKPFACPTCGAESRDRIDILRHLAFTHKKLYEVTHLTEEEMKKMIKS